MVEIDTTYSSAKKPIKSLRFKHCFMRRARQLILPALLYGNLYAQYNTANQYINAFKPIAQKLSIETGIPASVILGVAIIESGHGSSKNCLLLKNHFGIVGKNNLAQTQKTYRSVYKQYSQDIDSYKDFCRVVKNKRFYAKLKGNTNYKIWLSSLNAANYSSVKQIWVDRITDAIQKHQLYLLDVKDLKAAN